MDRAKLILDNFYYIIDEHLEEMICIRDLDGNYIFKNSTVRKIVDMFEQNKDAIYFSISCENGYFDSDKIYSFDELCKKTDKVALRELKAIEFELCCVVRDEWFYFKVTKSPIYSKDGLLIGVLGNGRDITQSVAMQKKIETLSHIDTLTSLPNRDKMHLDIEKNHPKVCIVFNIDKFREINDFFGSDMGDSILKQVASWLNGVHKTYRIAGDEFAMLFYDELNKEQVSAFVDDVLKRFSFATFFIQNEQIPVRLNIGVAIDSDKLAIQADIALHESKEKRLKYAFYEKVANIEELYRTNLMIAANVHSAIFENRLVCHYQPILDYATGRVVKYESLVRLLCTDSTVMSPMTFLHIAKKTKLYSHITQMVIEQSCKEFKDKKEEFSINISIDDILDPLTTEHIIKTITNTNTASRVVFEILESDGIQNYDTVEGFIKQVKALGAKIAIDDFGSGYSNFEHILRLDIDYIKIDGTLIKDILTKPYSQIIVGTIVDFAKKIKAKTIAEFVSSKEIFDLLKEMGVDFAQGYHIGKPKPF